MNSLTELKNALVNNGHKIAEFKGYVLITCCGSRFTLAMDQFYRNGVAITNKELKEFVNGKPQAPQSKEPTSGLPDVQAPQGKRSKPKATGSSRAGKALGHRSSNSRV